MRRCEERLSPALRSAAAHAADCTRGGAALVLVAEGDSTYDLRLRAAGGFAHPDDARAAAHQVLTRARETLPGPELQQLPGGPEIGSWAAAALLLLPLHHDGAVHGVLAVGFPRAPSDESIAAARGVADSLSLRLDHARLRDEQERLKLQLDERSVIEDEKSEEVLKLSEALFAQDIELLRNNEKLGKIEQLKNDFIEKMSCELRTPLNSIIESIISVLTGEDAALSDSAKVALRSALDDGTDFLRTLQNILDLWKIKQGELPVEIQDVNFRELVDEAIFSAQDTIGSKPLTVTPLIPESFPRIRTDLAKVNQILFLLLDNAAKFTPSGEIEIAARIEEGPNGRTLQCSVKDTGVGICPDDQAVIFDEFFQVDEPSSRKYRGAGLGLTLVRDLVTLLEGELSIKSDVGHGTTVGLRLPIQLA